jgi:hypothetical protein
VWWLKTLRLVVLVLVVAAFPLYSAVGRASDIRSPNLAQLATSVSVALRQGWNLVASPVIPNDPAPASVFASIAGRYDLVYAYDACDALDPWKEYDPKAPPNASDLSTISVTRGLWIKATADATWIITGTALTQVNIPLCAGQNLIGYPSIGATALPDALAGIAGKYNRVYAFDSADTADPWKLFDPQAPAFVNDLTALSPTKGYWIEMKESSTLMVGAPASTTRRVNAPYFDGAANYSELAVFWFGRVTPTENYADVRMGYNRDKLIVNVAAFDRRLWYDTSPSTADLTAWDAVTIYLSLDSGQGSPLSANAYRFIGQLNWWEDRTQWQAAYRYNGTAWAATNTPFTTSSGWRGDVPNTDVDDRGWNVSFGIPFTSLGLAGPPPQGTIWRLAIVLHDRDDAAGTPIPDKTWPETMAVDQPATWGVLNFGVLGYTPPAATPGGTVTIRHGLNGAAVSDAAVGGYVVCGAGTDYWTQWGDTKESFYSVDHDRFNVQNQSDISDWPCFSKYYVTFPLSSLPASKVVLSAILTLHQIGNAGEGWTPGPQPSFIQVLTVDRAWDEAGLTWNNAPLASENITGTWVDPLPSFPGWPGVPRQWNVSRAVAQAYTTGQPLRLALYSADELYHSGRYFSSSDVGDWDEVGRPTLTVTWGEPQ